MTNSEKKLLRMVINFLENFLRRQALPIMEMEAIKKTIDTLRGRLE